MLTHWQYWCIRGLAPEFFISTLRQSSRNMSDLAAGKKAAAIQAVNDYVKVNNFVCVSGVTNYKLAVFSLAPFRTIKNSELGVVRLSSML